MSAHGVDTSLQRLAAWDRAAAQRLALPDGSPWRRPAALCAHAGDGVLWVLVAAVTLVWGTNYLRGVTLVATLAVLVSTGFGTVVKYTVRRHRPRELPQFYALKSDRYAFPSGHATRTAAIAVVVGHFVPELALPSCALALVVALCRILVGVHYPSDVLAGLLIGTVGARCILYVM